MQDRFVPWVERLIRWLRRMTPVGLGLVLSAFLIAAWSQTLSAWGASLAFVCGLIVSAGIAVAWGLRRV